MTVYELLSIYEGYAYQANDSARGYLVNVNILDGVLAHGIIEFDLDVADWQDAMKDYKVCGFCFDSRKFTQPMIVIDAIEIKEADIVERKEAE